MSFWSKIGDAVTFVKDAVVGTVDKPLDMFGINIGQDKLYSSSKRESTFESINRVLSGSQKAAATAAAPGIVSKLVTNKQIENAVKSNVLPSTTAAANAVSSPYVQEESWLQTIAKAIGGTVNIDSKGRVTGNVQVGTQANPQAVGATAIFNSIAKYWWVALIVIGAIFIFRRK